MVMGVYMDSTGITDAVFVVMFCFRLSLYKLTCCLLVQTDLLSSKSSCFGDRVLQRASSAALPLAVKRNKIAIVLEGPDLQRNLRTKLMSKKLLLLVLPFEFAPVGPTAGSSNVKYTQLSWIHQSF